MPIVAPVLEESDKVSFKVDGDIKPCHIRLVIKDQSMAINVSVLYCRRSTVFTGDKPVTLFVTSVGNDYRHVTFDDFITRSMRRSSATSLGGAVQSLFNLKYI